MKPIINKETIRNIENFYQNVARKYRHTYDYNDMRKDIDTAINSILKIENGLVRRKPTISRWSGMYMATSADHRWNFAYRIEGNTIYVEDACHAQNMHEAKINFSNQRKMSNHNKKINRLTESHLKNIISKSIKKVLKESDDYRYMSDEDIKGQYSDMQVTNIDLEHNKNTEGWSGTIEVNFPNADDIDYDSSIVDTFFVYDENGDRIAFDNWYPEEQSEVLKNMIRQEIQKMNMNEGKMILKEVDDDTGDMLDWVCSNTYDFIVDEIEKLKQNYGNYSSKEYVDGSINAYESVLAFMKKAEDEFWQF